MFWCMKLSIEWMLAYGMLKTRTWSKDEHVCPKLLIRVGKLLTLFTAWYTFKTAQRDEPLAMKSPLSNVASSVYRLQNLQLTIWHLTAVSTSDEDSTDSASIFAHTSQRPYRLSFQPNERQKQTATDCEGSSLSSDWQHSLAACFCRKAFGFDSQINYRRKSYVLFEPCMHTRPYNSVLCMRWVLNNCLSLPFFPPDGPLCFSWCWSAAHGCAELPWVAYPKGAPRLSNVETWVPIRVLHHVWLEVLFLLYFAQTFDHLNNSWTLM